MRAAFVPFSDQTHVKDWWMKHSKTWDDQVTQIYTDERWPLAHGTKMSDFVKNHPEVDHILFLEEDGIILRPGMIGHCFDLIESGQFDLVGSPRMSCSPELAQACADKWHLDYSGLGDKGPNFWPCFLFVKREDLLKTDLWCDFKAWNPGEYVAPLDHTAVGPLNGDTFVWMSIQLRALGLKIHEIPQYHSSPNDLADFESWSGVFDKKAPWFHLGSLSGSFGPINTPMEHLEAEKRVMWHEICGKNMDEVITKWGLDRYHIDRWKEAYLRLFEEEI